MGRIRTVKPEFFKHSDLYDAEAESNLPLRLAFAGLWTVADREGRFRWKPRELKLEVLPHDQVDFSRVLHALATRGFLVKYASGSEDYGWIPGFTRHQIVNNREQGSKLPAPTKQDIDKHRNTTTREARVERASLFRQPRVPHAPSGERELEREGELEGRKKDIGDFGFEPTPPEVDPSVDFERFWDAYPRKVGKGQARRAWTKAASATDIATLIAAATRYAEIRAGEDPEFTKHPATWLNGECWNDEIAAAPPARNGHHRGNGADEPDPNAAYFARHETHCRELADHGLWLPDWGAKPDFAKPAEAQPRGVSVPETILRKFCAPAVPPPA